LDGRRVGDWRYRGGGTGSGNVGLGNGIGGKGVREGRDTGTLYTTYTPSYTQSHIQTTILGKECGITLYRVYTSVAHRIVRKDEAPDPAPASSDPGSNAKAVPEV